VEHDHAVIPTSSPFLYAVNRQYERTKAFIAMIFYQLTAWLDEQTEGCLPTILDHSEMFTLLSAVDRLNASLLNATFNKS
jgi:hypothetical protein